LKVDPVVRDGRSQEIRKAMPSFLAHRGREEGEREMGARNRRLENSSPLRPFNPKGPRRKEEK